MYSMVFSLFSTLAQVNLETFLSALGAGRVERKCIANQYVIID